MSYEERAWFDKTVPILDKRVGTRRFVSNAAEAGRILTNEWPATKGKSHRDACNAVLGALERYKDRDAKRKARDAFEAAAKDAGISG